MLKDVVREILKQLLREEPRPAPVANTDAATLVSRLDALSQRLAGLAATVQELQQKVAVLTDEGASETAPTPPAPLPFPQGQEPPSMRAAEVPLGAVKRRAKVKELVILLVDGPGVVLYSSGVVESVDEQGAEVRFGNLTLHIPHHLYAVADGQYRRKLGKDENVWTDVDKRAREAGEATPDPLVCIHGPGVYGDPDKPATKEEMDAQARRAIGLKPKEASPPLEPVIKKTYPLPQVGDLIVWDALKQVHRVEAVDGVSMVAYARCADRRGNKGDLTAVEYEKTEGLRLATESEILDASLEPPPATPNP